MQAPALRAREALYRSDPDAPTRVLGAMKEGKRAEFKSPVYLQLEYRYKKGERPCAHLRERSAACLPS